MMTVTGMFKPETPAAPDDSKYRDCARPLGRPRATRLARRRSESGPRGGREKKSWGFPSQFIKSTKVLIMMATVTPQGRRLRSGYHTPEQVTSLEPDSETSGPDSRPCVLITTLLGGFPRPRRYRGPGPQAGPGSLVRSESLHAARLRYPGEAAATPAVPRARARARATGKIQVTACHTAASLSPWHSDS